ncbi:MAG: type I 3-dehydroquinate dehydratase [Verrucomicrobia bacterium]|nr:type I 3-dehydroquinate dehydratase [Verrucomicrobiota bacterium]
MAMLFGSTSGPTLLEVKEQLQKARGFIDGIELRLDLLKWNRQDLAAFVQEAGLPVMLTPRGERSLSLLHSLCKLHPAYIDLDAGLSMQTRQILFESYPDIRFIASIHDDEGMPDLDLLLEQIQTPYAHIHKIAVTANSTLDAIRLLLFLKKRAPLQPLIAIAMGPLGEISRILSPVMGGYLTFASIGPATAPGQIPAQTLHEEAHFSALNPHTALYALLGTPIAHSKSPRFHNAAFRSKNRNALYLRLPTDVPELPLLFKLLQPFNFQGFSVTMPLKEAILPLVDSLSPEVQVIGACNTLVKRGGSWQGHNTDAYGALEALERHHPVRGKRMVCLGAGGSAKAIVYEAKKRGGEITVLNRTPAKAHALGAQFSCPSGGLELLPSLTYEILISCIPDTSEIDPSWILPGVAVMDIVTTPRETPLLQKAALRGCHCIYGEEMFLSQALKQQELWDLF